ncbi:MAG: ATP-binding cassette domain-containing protein [Bacilli bacterium]|nr:ATP-binding cassette domain-containing protein [Bacilli bacterium]
MENKEIVLSVKDLKVNFSTDHGYVQAVRGVSFDLYKGETLCIVGESGSGKSVTSKTIMGILSANARIVSGSIMYEGEDLTKVSEDEFHRIRGHKIGMIFQDPLSSLNPIMRIGKQITEAMLLNGNRLKKMRQELTATEFVAYKNAITAYKSELNRGKEAVKFLKSEKKKEVERIKNVAKNESDGKLYALSQDYGLEKVTIKHKYDSLVKEQPENVASINEERNKALAEAKVRYEATRKEIKENAQSQKASNKEQLAALKADFNQKIKEAKTNNETSKSELRAKYKPLIAETKATYLAKNKEAKVEVAKVKEQYKQEYLEEINSGVDPKEAKKHYQSKVKITHAEAKARALKIMEEVGIPFPEKRFKQYPFEFSGGMRQRIVIAIALTADPDILICDEPTTALDVTIQAQILELINRIKAERHMTCIFITHDLGVVANMADRVAVMYAGKIVEYGTEEEIFYDPRHPYTWALLSSIPDIDSKERLDAIPGTPPNLIYPPVGDAFALRSKYAMKIDFKKEPPLFKVSDTHYAATWLLDPRAPKVEMPAIVKTRIESALSARKQKPSKKTKEDISNAINPLETGEVAKASSELAMEQHAEDVLKEAKEFEKKNEGGNE